MKRMTWSLAAALAAALIVGVLGATASSAAKTSSAATAPGVTLGPYEIQPDAEKDVDRDVPSTKSKSNAPRIVPGQASRVASSNPGSTGFAGLNFADQRTADNGNQFSLEPPDQGLCEGNGLVVEPVNSVLSIYSTAGVKQGNSTESLTQFFTGQSQIVRSPLHRGPFLSDPRCYYDPASQRFFMTILQFGQDPLTGAFEGPSFELLAVSKSSSPSTDPSTWYHYAIETTNDGTDGTPSHPGCPCYGDQPLLGADQYGIYITSNEFSINGPEFNGAQVYAVDKAAAVAGTLKYQYVAGAGGPLSLAEGIAYSVQPATSPTTGSWDTANGGTEFLMSALDFDATTDNRVAVWALTNTSSLDSAIPAVSLSAPAIVSSETYGQPPNAEQQKGPIPLGTALGNPENLLATNDDRMNQVVYADGKLWGAVNTVIRTSNGVSTQTDRSGIAYFIVSPSTSGSPATVSGSIAKQGYVALGNNDNVLFPSIAVNARGKGVMAFSVSGHHYFPSAAYAPIDATNGTGDIHIAAAGVVPADGFTGYPGEGGNGVERWGDYSAAVPGDNGSIWVASEWIPGTFGYTPFIANWGTFINDVTP